MAERIDELQLLIGSDASGAIRQLGDLAGALDKAASSARGLSSATSFASKFVSTLNKLSSVNLDRTISNLERLSKLDLSNLKDKTVTIQLKVQGADEAERAKYASQDAAREIEKNSAQIAKALGQKFNVDLSGIKDLKSAVKEMIQDFANGGGGANATEKMFGIIAEHGKESEAAIMGVEKRYQEFINDMNKYKFSTSGITSAAERENALSGGALSSFRKDAESIDTIWEEIMGKFPDMFTAAERAASTTSDQMDVLVNKMQEVRSMLDKHEISNPDTFDNIGNSVFGAAEKAFTDFNASKDKFMKESMDKIPIDLNIDQNRFETQIQQAITKATDKTYHTKPIKLDLDNKSLRDSVEAAFSLIDIAKLPQFAEGFEKVSQSISTMNQTNIKDTGIQSFTNALHRLVSTDTSKFDTGAFQSIGETIKDLAKVGDVGRGMNSFVSSIARLANAGDKTNITAEGLKKLIPQLKDSVTEFSKLDAIDATITSFVASLAKLATAGDKAGKTAENLSTLSDAVMEFLDALSGAPEINENIAQTIQGLGNLAAAGTNAGKAMNSVLGGGSGGGNGFASTAATTIVNTTTGAFKKLLSISLKLGGQGASALGNFLAKLRLIPSQATAIDRTALTFGNLLRAVLPFYGLRGLFDWGKEAFEAGSSIVELENVIDTSFGNLKKGYEDISGYVYKWAQGTIDAFGVSQIAAEKYAGRIMAMFNSSGFDITEGMRDSAAKMTTDLIERAGDIASFYDITVDEAMTKIQSGLAGMNRPLRSIGVNMSVANLQAYAMSQGITTAWKEMDQATQMALRYEYILNATKYAEGDFARTSLSAANQVRLLTLNFQQLSAVMGQGLISAVAPVISWLNLLIKKLIQAATAFRTFMWTLFGKPLQAARGLSDDMAGYLDDASDSAGGLSDAAGGASDGLGSAGKAAKNLKKQLQVLPFDELNQLAKDTASAGSGGSGGGGGAGGGGGLGAMGLLDDLDTNFDLSGNETIDKINKWAKRIRDAFIKHDWAGVGANIAHLINYGFGELYKLLDWKNIGPKITGFISAFQTAVNTMVETIDWGLVGRTFARGLNDVVYTLRAWITGFNWKRWGELFALGLNSMIDEWDADAFGRLIADKFQAAWDWFGGFVRKFKFKDFGKKLKEMVLGAIDEINWGDVGETLAEFFNGISDTIIEFFEDGTVATEISDAFCTLVNNFLEDFDEDKAKRGIEAVKKSLKTAIGNAIMGVDKSKLMDDFVTLLSELPWGTIGALVGVAIGANLVKGIIGVAFTKSILTSAISSAIGTGGGVAGGLGSAASGGSSAAAGAAATGGATLLGTAGGVAALIAGMKALQGAIEAWTRSKGITPAEDVIQKSGKKMFSDDYDADVVSGAKATPIDTGESSRTTTVSLEAVTKPSFLDALSSVNLLRKFPTITKWLDSKRTKEYNANEKDYENWDDDTATKKANAKTTSGYNSVHADWWRWLTETITKFANAKTTNAYTGIKTDYYKWLSETIAKTANAKKTQAYNTVNSDYVHWLSNTATKTANATTTKAYDTIKSDWNGFSDKWITAHVEADISGFLKRVDLINDQGDYVNTLLRTNLVYYAKGGLFTNAAVFGEAGDEAAIPLERKSTMRRIANAIVDSGGMGGSGDAVADAIARRILPALASMIDSGNERPINVNATLYTENDEVLARAVTRGQRSLDKRYNPVSQFSY